MDRISRIHLHSINIDRLILFVINQIRSNLTGICRIVERERITCSGIRGRTELDKASGIAYRVVIEHSRATFLTDVLQRVALGSRKCTTVDSHIDISIDLHGTGGRRLVSGSIRGFEDAIVKVESSLLNNPPGHDTSLILAGTTHLERTSVKSEMAAPGSDTRIDILRSSGKPTFRLKAVVNRDVLHGNRRRSPIGRMIDAG